MTTADITVEFACSRKEMVAERIEDVCLAAHGIAYEIASVVPGRLEEGRDVCNLDEYRQAHGLAPHSDDPKWAGQVPDGCTSHLAHVRLRAMGDGTLTRARIVGIPFGDHDLGFSIDRVGDDVAG